MEAVAKRTERSWRLEPNWEVEKVGPDVIAIRSFVLSVF